MFSPSAAFRIINYYQSNTVQNQTNNQIVQIKENECSCFCSILNLFGIFKSTKNEKTKIMQSYDIKKLEDALSKKIGCDFKITKDENNNKINIFMISESKKDFKNFKTCCSFSGINEKDIKKTKISSSNYKIQISQANAKKLLNELNSGSLMNCEFYYTNLTTNKKI